MMLASADNCLVPQTSETTHGKQCQKILKCLCKSHPIGHHFPLFSIMVSWIVACIPDFLMILTAVPIAKVANKFLDKISPPQKMVNDISSLIQLILQLFFYCKTFFCVYSWIQMQSNVSTLVNENLEEGLYLWNLNFILGILAVF